MDTSGSRRRARGGVVIVTAALALVATAVVSQPEPAGAQGSFRALAAADGARMTILASNAPGTDVPIDNGAPVAQASLDSLGTNQSFASHPYPGDVAISGPGLMAGLTDGQVAPPNYPFYVSADYPIVPEQELEYPGYHLQATATKEEVAASARSGGASADSAVTASTATARAHNDGATVVGEASSVTTGFSAGPLTIGRVLSTVSISRQPGGALTRESSLDVSGAKVGDTAISVTPTGITVGGANAPLGDGGSAVAQALSDAGITMKYLAARETESGLVAPTLEVSWTGDVPGPFSPAGFVWTLGRSVARIDGGGGSGSAAPGLPAAASSHASPPTEPAPAQPDEVMSTAPPVEATTAAASAGAIKADLPGLDETLPGTRSSPEVAFASPDSAAGPSAFVAEGPALGSTVHATPVGSGAPDPPGFDVTSTFAVMALALAGAWILSGGVRSVSRHANRSG